MAATMVEYPLPQVLKSRGRLRRLVIAHYSISESVLNWPWLRSTLSMETDAIRFLTGSVLYSAAQLCPRGGMRSADLGVATASADHDLRREGNLRAFQSMSALRFLSVAISSARCQRAVGSRVWALYRLRMTSDTLANTTLTSLVSTAVV